MTAAKHYKCQNFGKCPLADKEELIHFDEDDRFQCASKQYAECPSKNPKCREELVAVTVKKRLSIPIPVLVGVPVVIVLAVILVAIAGVGKSTPAAKEKAIAAELKKVWPWLAD
jgi:hypothetical protein